MNVSVILPTYNEKDNIEELIQRIQRAVSPYEIIVVDDDSPDGTWRIVESLSKRFENLRLLRRIENRGLASAIAEGIEASEGDTVVWMDCDLSMPPESIAKIIKSLEKADVAIGSRYIKDGRDNRGFSRVFLSRAINLFASLLLYSTIKDYTTGFVAAKKKVFTDVEIRGEYGEYCIDFLFKVLKKGYRVSEIPYVFIKRSGGETKTATSFLYMLRHGWVYGLTVIKLRLMK